MERHVSHYLPARRPPLRRTRADDAGASGDFAGAVLAGFSRKPRSLPCRFFYDARGSELFKEITQLEEYYPMRARRRCSRLMAPRSPR